jgi:hypothetical protein
MFGRVANRSLKAGKTGGNQLVPNAISLQNRTALLGIIFAQSNVLLAAKMNLNGSLVESNGFE